MGAASTGGQTKFIPHIEGLRALAVGIVIAYHAGVPFTGGGFIGVDVFFVISGFLITGLLLKELESTGYVDVFRFYARRARRLLPAATLVLVATAVAAWMILPPLRWRTVAYDILAAALWSGNIRSAFSQFDYLTADDAPSPVLHFWSLGVEEQFYLIWPAALAISYAVLWRWMTARNAVLITSVVTLVTSFLVGQLWTDTQQPFAFFLLPSRAWELAAGSLLAALYPYVGHVPDLVRKALGLAGVLTILTAAVLLDSSVRWPGYAAAIPVIATLAVIVATGAVQRRLSIRPMLAIGRWSYSLYLWHWPVLMLAPVAVGRPLRPFETFLAVAGASTAALLAYALVENPLRSQHALLVGAWRSLALGGALIAVSSTAAVALHAAPLPQTEMTVASSAVTTESSVPAGYEQLLTAVETVRSVPFGLTPALADAEKDRFSVDLGECFASNPVDRAPETGCYFGDVTAERTVAIVGDSHAAQWTGALLEIAEKEKFRLLVLTKSACPAPQLRRASAKLGSYPECRSWNTSVMKRLEDERPEVTLVGGYVGYAIERQMGSYEHRRDAWVEVFDRMSAFTRPVLIADTPYPGLDVPVCLSANLGNVAACVQTREAMTNAEDGRQAETDAARSRNVAIVETFDLVCPTQMCPVIVGNVLVYRDESHISAQFSRWLARPLADEIIPLLPGSPAR